MKSRRQKKWERDYARYLLTPPGLDEKEAAKVVTEEKINAFMETVEFKVMVMAVEFYQDPVNKAAYKKWLRAKKKRRKIICVKVNSKAST